MTFKSGLTVVVQRGKTHTIPRYPTGFFDLYDVSVISVYGSGPMFSKIS